MFGSRNFLFARTAAGGNKIFMWGGNNSGQLGLGDATNRSSPVQVGSTWSKLSINYNTLAVDSAGKLWSWGRNNYGQLGLGDTVYRSSPVQIGALTNWATPVAGRFRESFCIKTDGTLWAWGLGTSGCLGQGDAISRSSPVQVGSSTNWTAIAAGREFVLTVDSAGKLFSWGLNDDKGFLGLGDIANRSSPVQVGALTTWKTPGTGSYHSFCVKTDGTLWAWGKAGFAGYLGTNNTISRSSPVQVGALTNWAIPNGGRDSSMCTKTDGTLWSWGYGSYGKLGIGSTAYFSSPKQIGALTNWSIPISGEQFNACLKTDGTLWAWGRNSSGQLGLGDTTNRNSPVQVGALTSWVVPAAGGTTLGCTQT